MERARSFVSLIFSLITLSGCVGSQEETETTLGIAPSAHECTNALNVNALNVNALNVNALNVNALNVNALNIAALTAIQALGPTGDLSRQLLEYTVGCALDSSQSFNFSWTDIALTTHDEQYWGSLGLEPTWSSSPLSDVGQRWVSACLASRVNWYGEHVIISARGSISSLSAPSLAETTSFTMLEGAFWGNLFTLSPELYACHHGPNDAHSRAATRDCAAGHLDANSIPQDCGIIHIVGDCDSVCKPMDTAGSFYPRCRPDIGAPWVDQVVTVFLE
jgi:hypothetical protein